VYKFYEEKNQDARNIMNKNQHALSSMNKTSLEIRKINVQVSRKEESAWNKIPEKKINMQIFIEQKIDKTQQLS